MSKIKELIKDRNNILVFDVDGVLATMEWGEHNHYELDDNDWTKLCEEGKNCYTENCVSKKMQNFFKDKNMKNVYVITKIGNNNEGEFKKEFVNKYYSIPQENVYYVEKDTDKKAKLFEIKQKNKEFEDYRIIMVEDSVNVLNDIMDNTNFSTVHISSFLDI